jgi:hypothetical protein
MGEYYASYASQGVYFWDGTDREELQVALLLDMICLVSLEAGSDGKGALVQARDPSLLSEAFHVLLEHNIAETPNLVDPNLDPE